MEPVAKVWQLLPLNREALERLAKALRVPPVVAQLLLNRGINEPEHARRFLDAPMKGLHPPEMLPGVTQAADRLMAAVRQGQRICVYGDYDVDGTAGTAISFTGTAIIGLLTAASAPRLWSAPEAISARLPG